MRKYMSIKKSVLIILCFYAFVAINIFADSTYEAEEQKNVLFISSYTENFMTVPDQIQGIKFIFEPYPINLDIEYMDSKRIDTKEHKQLFYQMLKNKLNNLTPYDAVIVGDDNALQFAMDYQQSLFKDLPIVFFCINDFDRARVAAKSNHITGLVEAVSLKETIEIAQKFNPLAKKVVAIIDNTLTGKGDKEQFYNTKDHFKTLTFEDLNVSNYTFKEFEMILQEIEEDTILLYLSMFQDKTEKAISIDEAVEILKSNTKVPVYRASIGGVGTGLLGGKMISYFEQGKSAAQIIIDVFDGVPIESIEVVLESPNKYIFDYDIIKKYNINEQLIPDDAVLINRKPTFFQQYKTMLIIMFLIITFFVLVIFFIIRDNIRRRAIERALQESHEELTTLYEELTATEEELRSQYNEIQRYTEKLENLQQKYEIAIKGTNSAVWEMNLENKKLYFSKEVSNILNRSIQENEDVNLVLEQFLLPEDRALLVKNYTEVINGTKQEIYTQVRIKDQEGNLKWLLVSGKHLTNLGGRLKFINGIVLDITKFKEQEAYIEHLAFHDSLTHLPNRIYFMNKLKEELEQAKKGAVLLLDLDNFKEINDILGHTYGDMVLQEVAKRLNNCVDQKMFISRFGGDEFLILIYDEGDSKITDHYINKIRHALKTALAIKEEEIHIHYSMGITRYPHDSNEANQLIMNADTAMYKVKNLGKNNHMFFDHKMTENLREKAYISAILRKALREEGFILMYQPQVCVETGEVVGFEALLRLKDHSIGPNLFIPIAEEAGLIIEIGRWVTKEAIRQIACWRERGFGLKPVAINFSTKQLRDDKYLDFLEKMLNDNKVDPKYLEIEITESILLERKEDTTSFLNELKLKGVKIALDDFGTGYSSLSYLTFMPVDKIKLDKSLSDRFLEMENIKVMDSIISLVHSLKLQVTAEGIEEVEQYRRLKIGGCDYIQGYLFSKPLKVEEIEKVYNYNYVETIK
ncbi:ABC transporter substrate binding protein [Cellulosilyticum sp. I15G10I2]|uniref:ABC transporter substrate binding protein n=1 Tax=Cellulosilyticum sp. I15G10I2 TaxID=1892843 RepID=UPI0009F2740B|nr:ABC transporter substrate binding protein [Cellulosilyticum sp. I15G10I2]